MDNIVWHDSMKDNMLDDGKIVEFMNIVCPKVCENYTSEGHEDINTIQNDESLEISRSDDPFATFHDKPEGNEIQHLKQEIGEYRRKSTDTINSDSNNPLTFWKI